MSDPDLDGIVPYIPFYVKDGNVVVEEWSEHFSSGDSAGTVQYLRYRTKKGKVSEPIVKRVLWD